MSLVAKAARHLDFSNTLTPRNQVVTLVAATFLARMAASRGPEELRENVVRDVPTFFIFLYLASIMENAIGYTLDKFSPASHAKNGYSLIKGQGAKNFIKTLNPFNNHSVRSFDDIKAIAKKITPENLKELTRNKAIVNTLGLLTPILILGVLLPWFNVQSTRKKLLQEQEKANNKALNLNPINQMQAGNNLIQQNQSPFNHFV